MSQSYGEIRHPLSLPPQYLRVVEKTIEDYDLMPDGRTGVAVSGGEDSVLLWLTLDQLGFDTTPAVYVDMGWQPGKGRQLQERYARLGKELLIIDIRDELETDTPPYPEPVVVEIRQRIGSLDEMTRHGIANVIETRTPCTDCHNVKLRAFERVLAEHNTTIMGKILSEAGIDRIALGYNRDDARAAFVRNAAYLELFFGSSERPPQRKYDRSGFLSVLEEFRTAFRTFDTLRKGNPEPAIIHRLRERVETGILDTDDVPNQPLIHKDTDSTSDERFKLISPLWRVSKFVEIRHLAVRHLGIQLEGSECAHGTPGTETSRDLALELLRTTAGARTGVLIDQLIRKGISETGDSIYDTRRNREKIIPGFKKKPVGGDKL